MKRLRRPKHSSESPKPRLDSWEILRTELDRSRRYGHSFVLISLGVSDNAPEESNGESDARWNDSGHSRAQVLAKLVRTTDCVWIDAGLVYVLLPASDRAVGVRFLKRVSEHASWILTSEDVGLVTFPEDGLTSDALLKALTKPAEQQLAPSGADRDRLEAPGPGLPTSAKGNGSIDGSALEGPAAWQVSGSVTQGTDIPTVNSYSFTKPRKCP